jgi:hypothetical protein
MSVHIDAARLREKKIVRRAPTTRFVKASASREQTESLAFPQENACALPSLGGVPPYPAPPGRVHQSGARPFLRRGRCLSLTAPSPRDAIGEKQRGRARENALSAGLALFLRRAGSSRDLNSRNRNVTSITGSFIPGRPPMLVALGLIGLCAVPVVLCVVCVWFDRLLDRGGF